MSTEEDSSLKQSFIRLEQHIQNIQRRRAPMASSSVDGEGGFYSAREAGVHYVSSAGGHHDERRHSRNRSASGDRDRFQPMESRIPVPTYINKSQSVSDLHHLQHQPGGSTYLPRRTLSTEPRYTRRPSAESDDLDHSVATTWERRKLYDIRIRRTRNTEGHKREEYVEQDCTYSSRGQRDSDDIMSSGSNNIRRSRRDLSSKEATRPSFRKFQTRFDGSRHLWKQQRPSSADRQNADKPAPVRQNQKRSISLGPHEPNRIKPAGADAHSGYYSIGHSDSSGVFISKNELSLNLAGLSSPSPPTVLASGRSLSSPSSQYPLSSQSQLDMGLPEQVRVDTHRSSNSSASNTPRHRHKRNLPRVPSSIIEQDTGKKKNISAQALKKLKEELLQFQPTELRPAQQKLALPHGDELKMRSTVDVRIVYEPDLATASSKGMSKSGLCLSQTNDAKGHVEGSSSTTLIGGSSNTLVGDTHSSSDGSLHGKKKQSTYEAQVAATRNQNETIDEHGDEMEAIMASSSQSGQENDHDTGYASPNGDVNRWSSEAQNTINSHSTSYSHNSTNTSSMSQSHGLESDTSVDESGTEVLLPSSESSQAVLRRLIRQLKKASVTSHKLPATSGSESSRSSSTAAVEKQVMRWAEDVQRKIQTKDKPQVKIPADHSLSGNKHPTLHQVVTCCDIIPYTITKHSKTIGNSAYGVTLFDSPYNDGLTADNQAKVVFRSPGGRKPSIGSGSGAFVPIAPASQKPEAPTLVAIEAVTIGSEVSELLQEGDFVIEVNKRSTIDKTASYVGKLLELATPTLHIVVARPKDIKVAGQTSYELSKEVERLRMKYDTLKCESERNHDLIADLRLDLKDREDHLEALQKNSVFLETKIASADVEIRKRQEAVCKWKVEWTTKAGQVDKLQSQLRQKESQVSQLRSLLLQQVEVMKLTAATTGAMSAAPTSSSGAPTSSAGAWPVSMATPGGISAGAGATAGGARVIPRGPAGGSGASRETQNSEKDSKQCSKNANEMFSTQQQSRLDFVSRVTREADSVNNNTNGAKSTQLNLQSKVTRDQTKAVVNLASAKLASFQRTDQSQRNKFDMSKVTLRMKDSSRGTEDDMDLVVTGLS